MELKWIYTKFNAKYVRSELNSTQNMYALNALALNALKLWKIYATFNANFLRSTLISKQNV